MKTKIEGGAARTSAERLGVFGGTFDPIHLGHLIVASHVREVMHLDRMVFVPASIPPHKRGNEISPGDKRLAMIRAAVKDDPLATVSRIELDRGGISYTIDTLRALKAMHPGVQLTLLIGMDNVSDFRSWKSPEAILEEAAVVVMTRPGYEPGPKDKPWLRHMELCEVPFIGISARDIRRRVANGKSIRYLVPEAVERYIQRHGLYRQHRGV